MWSPSLPPPTRSVTLAPRLISCYVDYPTLACHYLLKYPMSLFMKTESSTMEFSDEDSHVPRLILRKKVVKTRKVNQAILWSCLLCISLVIFWIGS